MTSKMANGVTLGFTEKISISSQTHLRHWIPKTLLATNSAANKIFVSIRQWRSSPL